MTDTQAGGARARRRVLLVDDDPGTLHVLSRGLSTVLDMFDVVKAHNGQEAIEILKDQSIDALVTDLAMPVLDGFALIAHITNTKRVLPVVVLSGMPSAAIDDRLAAYGGLRVLRKPAGYQDVADQLLKAIEHVALGEIEGIPLAGILQLVESERRSCTVVVSSGRRKGRLHFQSGRLIDAYSEDFGADGEAAAYDILGWNDTAITFERLPDGLRRTIHTPMQLMLIELAVTHDKARADAERAIAPLAHDRAALVDAEGSDLDAGPDALTSDQEDVSLVTADHSREPEGSTPDPIDVDVDDLAGPSHHHEPFDPEHDHDDVEPVFGEHPDARDDAQLDDDDAAQPVGDGLSLPASFDERPADHTPETAAVEAEATEMAEVVEAADAAAAPLTVPATLEAAAQALPDAPEPHEPHVSSLLEAMERLSQRVKSADEALAGVTAEIAAFREAQRAFDEALAARERRRRDLEAFRNDVAGLARQILQRVDAMFPEPSGEDPPRDAAEARREP